jgi:hypothetical protein
MPNVQYVYTYLHVQMSVKSVTCIDTVFYVCMNIVRELLHKSNNSITGQWSVILDEDFMNSFARMPRCHLAGWNDTSPSSADPRGLAD